MEMAAPLAPPPPIPPRLTAAWLLEHRQTIADLAATAITPAAVTRLRHRWGQEITTQLANLATQQVRARAKLGPGTWMATEKSIAQATDRHVADYKASLFAAQPVYDLCCGIGGDTLALARRGPVVAIDIDPMVSAMAAANLRLARVPESSLPDDIPAQHPTTLAARFEPPRAIVIAADVTTYPLSRGVAINIDPDRRPGNHRGQASTTRRRGSPQPIRVSAPNHYLPSLKDLHTLLAGSPAWLAKLAPAADLENTPDAGELIRIGHRQWISFNGSVREQALLGGTTIALAGGVPGGRSAVRIGRHGVLHRFAVNADTVAELPALDRSVPTTTRPAELIFDLDPAIRAAGLTSCFATQHGWTSLGGPAGFWCGDRLPAGVGWGQAFETLWTGPADLRRIRKALLDRRWGITTIKARGTDHDPNSLLRQLRPKGAPFNQQTGQAHRADDSANPKASRAQTEQLVLLLGRHEQGLYGVIAKPLSLAATERQDQDAGGESSTNRIGT